MKIRVLGAHNMETAQTKHTCFLIDDSLAIDAGSLMTSLSAEEKNHLRAILLTHRHFDHVRDLPSLGLQTMDNGVTLDLYGLPDTLDAVSTRLMDGLLYPNFTVRPTPEHPKYRLHAIAPGRAFNVCGIEVLPLSVPHGAPAVGFVVRKGSSTAAFTGDTGGGLLPFLAHTPPPQVLFLEVTFANSGDARARASPPPHPLHSARRVGIRPTAGTVLATNRRSAPGPAPRTSNPPRTRRSLQKAGRRLSPLPSPAKNSAYRVGDSSESYSVR